MGDEATPAHIRCAQLCGSLGGAHECPGSEEPTQEEGEMAQGTARRVLALPPLLHHLPFPRHCQGWRPLQVTSALTQRSSLLGGCCEQPAA